MTNAEHARRKMFECIARRHRVINSGCRLNARQCRRYMKHDSDTTRWRRRAESLGWRKLRNLLGI